MWLYSGNPNKTASDREIVSRAACTIAGIPRAYTSSLKIGKSLVLSQLNLNLLSFVAIIALNRPALVDAFLNEPLITATL